MNRITSFISFDVIIPIYNEQASLPALHARLKSVFSPSEMARHRIKTAHFIFIDDGSIDRSAELITGFIKEGLPATLIRLSRNFGHQNALTAGLHYSKADVTAVIDGDLQDPPEVMMEMLVKWRNGYNVVFGQRRRRKENPLLVFCYWAFYRIMRALAEQDVPLDSGDFSLMDRSVIEALRALPEKLRFPRGLRSWVGFNQCAHPYERDARKLGESKYNFAKLCKLAKDGITATSVKPLKFVEAFTALFLLATTVFFGLAINQALRPSSAESLAGWFFAGFGLVTFTGFLITCGMSIVCAYIGRIYLEVKDRPTYILREVVSAESLELRRTLSPTTIEHTA